jgi:hypothetical protein
MRERLVWPTVAVGLFVVTLLPYLLGRAWASPNLVFLGLLFDVPDHTQYWAWVRASHAGLFISNTMTPEPNPATFMNPMMWLLARVQAIGGFDYPLLFQLWRAAATAVLVAGAVRLTRVFVSDSDVRRTATWVILLGAGLGWTLVIAKTLLHLADAPFPNDIYTLEPNTFWTLLSYPYLALAQGLLALTFASTWLAFRTGKVRYVIWSAVSAFALAATHAYDLLIVYAVLGAAIALLTARHRRMPWRLVAAAIAVGVLTLPIALYYRHLTTASPLWRSILAQYANAGVWTPSPPHLVILMGVPLLLALAAVLRRTTTSDEDLFLIAWAVVGGVLPYLPVVFQIKLLTAWQFPIAILAAQTWHHAWRRLAVPTSSGGHGPRRELVATALLVILVVPTNLYLFAWRCLELRRKATPYFAQMDEQAALTWLTTHETDGPVIAREEFGRLVPGYTGKRAVLAHWAMTNRYFERRTAMNAFFSPHVDEGARARLQRALGATFVVWSAPPGMAPPFDPGVSATRELVFERPNARVYKVLPQVAH